MPDDVATFLAPADAYDAHVGRYGAALAATLIDAVGIPSGARALDVACGPGALTVALAGRLGASRVAAVDQSEPFVAACRAHVPRADVRIAGAEALPFDDASFDAVLSQHVVNFVSDARRAVAEMARVTVPGGVVAACVWDYAEGMTLLRTFWHAAVALDREGAGPSTSARGCRIARPTRAARCARRSADASARPMARSSSRRARGGSRDGGRARRRSERPRPARSALHSALR